MLDVKVLQEAPVEGKTVLVRTDYNVPLSAEGRITDASRIEMSLPTIKYLIARDAKVVLFSHLGQPNGEVVEELRLDPIASKLSELLAQPVKKFSDCIGEEVEQGIAALQPRQVAILENLRFHPGEGANDRNFAAQLAKLGDIFVNDAFATLHRAHASLVGITEFLPSYAGLLMQKEIESLTRLLQDPERPYVVIIGGQKARSKLSTLHELINKVDVILIGGGVAFTFLRAQGYEVGNSIVDETLFDDISTLLKEAKEKEVPILLPLDVVMAQSAAAEAETAIYPVGDMPRGWMGLDIGPKTIAAFVAEIKVAKTIVWAGPMGMFEIPQFAVGTRKIAEALAQTSAFSVVGGGETGEALTALKVADLPSYISTGGSACLTLLRGKSLLALEVLRR
ncbi:phosphoglycerate kinase [Candidatus Acetothermia bacterium]|jgi:phosphoglycerate kinase|nr:phosphoglycerate kinase [Candidatus Acetothermia bacterium]MCI2427409.1 phosphoglycerate kinase [Candidatus Acetothermia bacterium]MCI2428564.1 phosphoglycerate kinase [Candidatus Acetothermia bacterium]